MVFRINVAKFRIKDPYERNAVIIKAASILKHYKYSSNDNALDEYLKKKTNMSLKECALKLLTRCKVQSNLEDELTVVFPLKADDDLAKLISYGPGMIKGSNILFKMFNQTTKYTGVRRWH